MHCVTHITPSRHFIHPVVDTQLVELAKGMHTSNGTFEAAKGVAEYLGKQVCVSEDRPGFVLFRVLLPTINEVIGVRERGWGGVGVDRVRGVLYPRRR